MKVITSPEKNTQLKLREKQPSTPTTSESPSRSSKAMPSPSRKTSRVTEKASFSSSTSKTKTREQSRASPKIEQQTAINRDSEDNEKKNNSIVVSHKPSVSSWDHDAREEFMSHSDDGGTYYTSSYGTYSSRNTSDDRSASGASSRNHPEARERLPSPRKLVKRGGGTPRKKRGMSTRYSDMTFQFTTSYNDQNINTSRAAGDEEEHEKYLRTLHNKATKHLKDGEYSACLDIFEDILRSHVCRYDKTNHRVAAALHNIAIVQLRDGKLDEALDAIEEAVRIRKVAFGADSPKLADSLNELGIILLSRKEFYDSIEAFNDALEISEATFGKQDIRVCKILNNIGCIYYEYGDFTAADKIFQETIAMQQKLQSDKTTNKDKPGALTSMSTLCNSGYVYIDSAQYQKAITVLEWALGTQMAVLDRGNKLILSTLDNLGYANALDCDYDKAVHHYDHLLALQTKQVGRAHIDISETLLKIVWVHVKLYEWDEARLKLERIKKIQLVNNADSTKLAKTDRLINEVNYQLLKYSSPSEAIAVSLTSSGVRNPFTGRIIDFSFLRPPTDDMTASIGFLKKPVNSSKMSGHKLNFS